MKRLALVLVCSVLTGCVTTRQTVEPSAPGQPSSFQQFLRAAAGAGPGLAAHDPSADTPLFSQIPAWDRAAEKRCCSVLSRTEFLNARCDTDQPLGGRTNRC